MRSGPIPDPRQAGGGRVNNWLDDVPPRPPTDEAACRVSAGDTDSEGILTDEAPSPRGGLPGPDARDEQTCRAVGSQVPTITIGPDEARVIDQAVAALARAPEVFVRGGALVEIVEDDPRTNGVSRSGPIARIARCPEARVRELLARSATWLGADGGGGHKQVHPPTWAVRAVMARGQWPGVRPLLGVAGAPTMRLDGSILDQPGYDARTALYLASDAHVRVPARPSREDARRAIALLLDVVSDFPGSPASKSAWLASLHSVVVRPAIDGPVPLILIDATTRGSGKSLLADVAAIVATGRPAARLTYSGDDAEVRKTITALAIAGDAMVLLDNVSGTLGTPSLDAALTGTRWRDRILGQSAMTEELPLRACWWATGNGVILGADLSRRALMVRLVPSCERPEERSGWRYPRLLEHVREHRAALLGAALTVVRAYVVAGRPGMNLPPIGSFEAWSDSVRSALVWAGQPDPCATVAELRSADAQADALRSAVAAWPVERREAATAADLVSRATPGSPWHEALLEWCPARGGGVPTPRELGYALRAVRGRIVGSCEIVAESDRTGTKRWALKAVAGDAGDAGDHSPFSGSERFVCAREDSSPSSHASPAAGASGGAL